MDFAEDWLFPLLGLFEGSGYDLWDWMTGRTWEALPVLGGWRWVRRRFLRYQFFPRGWMPKT